MKPWTELRLHLWFWCDRPACDGSLRPWVKSIPYADASLFNSVQPHYTAAPIFVGGVDPVTERSGLLPGGVVTLPPKIVNLTTWRAREAAARAEREGAKVERRAKIDAGELPPVDSRDARASAEYELRRACDKIRNCTGPRHLVIRDQAYRVGRYVQAGIIDNDHAYAALEAAALANRR